MEAPSSAVIQMALFEFGVSAVTRICRPSHSRCFLFRAISSYYWIIYNLRLMTRNIWILVFICFWRLASFGFKYFC